MITTSKEPLTYEEQRTHYEKKAAELTSAEWKRLRILCKTNLFFLCSILGYKRLSTNLHGDLCKYMDESRTERFKEILLPRGHFKSSICTIAHSVQLILPDDTGSLPWPYNLGPEIRILLCHAAHGVSSRFLGAITRAVMYNESLLTLFPEILPDPLVHRVNKTELEIPHRINNPEPTIDTMGTGASSESKHYNYIKLDDMIGRKHYKSRTEMEAAIDFFDNIQSFFSLFSEDILDLVGTRWGKNDVYGHAEETYGAKLSRFVKGFWKKDENGDFDLDENHQRKPIFPEEFTRESVEILQKNVPIWNAQYLNDPQEGDGEFPQNWLRFFYWTDVKARKFKAKMVDGHFTDFTCQELDRVFLVDPAVSGQTGFVVTGTAGRGYTFTLEAIKKAWSPPEFIDFLFQRVLFWQPRLVAIESVNFSALYESWLAREMAFRRIYFRVEPIVISKKEDKGARIMGLSSYYANWQLFHNPAQEDIIDEFRHFNSESCDNSHLLDALSQGPVVWKKFSGLRQDDAKIAEMHRKVLASRDPVTGYTPIVYSQ